MSRERDLDDEVEAHLAEAAADYVARGMSPVSDVRDVGRNNCANLARGQDNRCLAGDNERGRSYRMDRSGGDGACGDWTKR